MPSSYLYPYLLFDSGRCANWNAYGEKVQCICPPYKVPRSSCLQLSGRRKKAQLFRCKGAPSNAVNAYPMPNRHEVFLAKRASQPVRIRHFGRHKCREPAITEQIEYFLSSGRALVFQQNPAGRREKSRPKKGDFSRYTVADETPGKVFSDVTRTRTRKQ